MKSVADERIKNTRELMLYGAYFRDCDRMTKYRILREDRQFMNMMNSALNTAKMFLNGSIQYNAGLDEALRRCKKLIDKESIRSYRNYLIINDYKHGMNIKMLAEKYGLTSVTISKILGL